MFYDDVAELRVIDVPAGAIVAVRETAGWLCRCNGVGYPYLPSGPRRTDQPPSLLASSAGTKNVCTFGGHDDGSCDRLERWTSAPRPWLGRLGRSARWSAHRRPVAPTARTAPRLHSGKWPAVQSAWSDRALGRSLQPGSAGRLQLRYAGFDDPRTHAATGHLAGRTVGRPQTQRSPCRQKRIRSAMRAGVHVRTRLALSHVRSFIVTLR